MPKVKILKLSNKPTASGKAIICGIKTLDKNNQEVWINGWGNDTTKSWQEGQEVELDIYQEEYNGTMRLKFRDVKVRNVFVELDEIKGLLNALLGRSPGAVANKPATTPVAATEAPAEEELDVSDIPF